MTVFDQKYFLIMNFVKKFVTKNLGLNPALDWISIFSNRPDPDPDPDSSKYLDRYGFSEFGSKNCQYQRSTKNDGRTLFLLILT